MRLFGFFILFPLFLSAQTETDVQLANYYFEQGEFDKALGYYEKLYDAEPNKFYFERYVNCLVETKDLKTAEKTIKKQWSSNKRDLSYPVMLGKFYEENEQGDKANKIYQELIDDLPPNPSSVIQLFNAFKEQGKNDFALATLQKGRKAIDNYPFNFQFAEVYGAMGDTKKMMGEYIDLIDYHSNYISTVQTLLERQIDFNNRESEAYVILKSALLERVQKTPDNRSYGDLLQWFFIQSRDFNAAYTQSVALDKRTKSEGRRVYELGNICIQNKDFSTARKCFQYVMSLGEENLLYYRAENALLNTRFLEITTQRNFSQSEIEQAVSEYRVVFNRNGYVRQALPLILEMTHIQAFYGNAANEAIEVLTKSLDINGLTDIQRAEIKMQLADILVLHGDIWEASLYYMQVDKDFKNEIIGHEAKFKNARIFYYDGEFDFAQSQLDVLKRSTSKLISNDAIKLSILITDNYGLDSNYAAMYWFASADLLIEQHQFDLAFQLFDSILINFPFHALGDEILLKKAHAAQLRGQWNLALEHLNQLLRVYPYDILADDALFQKGDILENHLFDLEGAKECYKSLLFDYKGSLYSTEARKRYRKLRGEKVEDELELE